MKKTNLLITTALAAIVFSFSSCESKSNDWDGNDYYTGRDTTIKGQRYHQSSFGYWYYLNNNRVTRFYPNTGYTQTLPVEDHRSGNFRSSAEHTRNGGIISSTGESSSPRGSGFGTSGRSSYHASSGS